MAVGSGDGGVVRKKDTHFGMYPSKELTAYTIHL